MSILTIPSLLSDDRGDALLSVQDHIVKFNERYATGSTTLDNLEAAGQVITTDYINVETQVPLWLRERNDTLGANLIPLLQAYYDWLYSKNGSGYILEDRFADIKDIDNCPDELIRNFLALYAPEFGAISDFEFISTDNIRKFLRSVQDRFYAIKSSKQAIAYFFSTLFGATGVEIISFGVGDYALIVNFQTPPEYGEWDEIVR